MVSPLRSLEGVLGEVFGVCGAAAELGNGRQLEDGHRLLEDAHRLLADLLLLGLCAGAETRHSGSGNNNKKGAGNLVRYFSHRSIFYPLNIMKYLTVT